MTRLNATGLRRGIGVLSIAAGASWAIKGLDYFFWSGDNWSCTPVYGAFMNTLDVVAMLGLVPVLLFLVSASRTQSRNVASVFGLIAAGAIALSGVTNFLEHCVVEHSIDGPSGFLGPYQTGGLLFLPSIIVFTGLLTRISFLPRWTSVVLFAGSLGWLRAEEGGLIAFGASWMVLGVVLLTQRNSVASSPDAGVQNAMPRS